MACCSCCSTRFVVLMLLISAIPIGYVIRLETGKPGGHVYEYYSSGGGGWMRECSKWDDLNSRFIVSFFGGGLGIVPVPPSPTPNSKLEEIQVVGDSDLAGNSTLGFTIDRPRNRLLACIGDVFGNRYSGLAAYDLTTWKRLFLTKLSGPEDEKALADDVAVDEEGNSYVTDVKGSKIWKVGVEGEFLGTITHPLFNPPGCWLHKFFGTNGIIYHPNGYFLVVHTMAGLLYKLHIINGMNVDDDEPPPPPPPPPPTVKLVQLVGSLKFGDGLQLLSPTKLIVAGNPTRLVESTDDWNTGMVIALTKGASHRIVTAATVKDGRVYLNHLFGLGYPKPRHILMEAVFSSQSS